MAAIDEVDVKYLATAVIPDSIREEIRALFWKWFEDHKDTKVTTVKVWFIRKTLYVRDLEPIFFLLFGPDNY